MKKRTRLHMLTPFHGQNYQKEQNLCTVLNFSQFLEIKLSCHILLFSIARRFHFLISEPMDFILAVIGPELFSGIIIFGMFK